jgi:hypothetical protein
LSAKYHDSKEGDECDEGSPTMIRGTDDAKIRILQQHDENIRRSNFQKLNDERDDQFRLKENQIEIKIDYNEDENPLERRFPTPKRNRDINLLNESTSMNSYDFFLNHTITYLFWFAHPATM